MYAIRSYYGHERRARNDLVPVATEKVEERRAQLVTGQFLHRDKRIARRRGRLQNRVNRQPGRAPTGA